MNSYSVIPLVAILAYLFPATVLLRDPARRSNRLLLIYLAVSFIWSLNSFLALANFSQGQLWLWAGLLPITGLWAVVSYFHFISSFNQSNVKAWIFVPYAIVLILAILAFIGQAPQVLQRSTNGELSLDNLPWLYLALAVGALFIGLSVMQLLRTYRAQENPLTQNRVLYYLLGAAMLSVLSLRIVVPAFKGYPLEILGNLGNVLLISYITIGYKLPDIRLVSRKYFSLILVSALTAAFYVLVFWGLHHILTWTTPIIFAISIMVFVSLILFYPLTMRLKNEVDKFYYGKSYAYRQMMLHLAHKAKNIIDLNELAEAILGPIVNAMNASQASLLLSNDGHFTSLFTKRLTEGERVMPVTLGKDSQIIKRLANADEPLSRELIDTAPEFTELSELDRIVIEEAKIASLFPVKNKGRLIGILTLSKRPWVGSYSDDDIYLIQKLLDDVAPALQNAQLYAEAKDKSHLDQLTGLLNHGYFHERVEEEISRCSRFGDVFSVVFMDLDYFKTFNDTYGHLAGDDVLRQIAQCIKRSTRPMDVAFRYGGDEFAIILPQAPLDDAHKVAERIRASVEREMDTKGAALTCSIGLASWPIDGVTREDILKAADTALYHSKALGRNRITLAPDVADSKKPEIVLGQEGESAILSTIHALAATVDAKDHSTYGHSTKTSQYATLIAKALGYSEVAIARIQAAALLHDIGKIRVSDALLTKQGPLDDNDWEQIRVHPTLGVAILKHVKGLNGCLAAIRYHHEHFDGSGYPGGIKGQEIPLDARIMAVADSYDAMTSPRPYRNKLTHEQAIAELKRCAGTQFDPEIVRVFADQWEAVKIATAKVRQNGSTTLASKKLIPEKSNVMRAR